METLIFALIGALHGIVTARMEISCDSWHYWASLFIVIIIASGVSIGM